MSHTSQRICEPWPPGHITTSNWRCLSRTSFSEQSGVIFIFTSSVTAWGPFTPATVTATLMNRYNNCALIFNSDFLVKWGRKIKKSYSDTSEKIHRHNNFDFFTTFCQKNKSAGAGKVCHVVRFLSSEQIVERNCLFISRNLQLISRGDESRWVIGEKA